ncbi:hypothetical protein N7456_006643 [Penicillium angulare]|uniref:F-box domain-containing protein n=1 Tax=Penicillium angulare TaxID=116970 RepID=A0A9W9KCE4_9EURO|nr:hypothetical protein N7456_006643 [Penicillium angulare]
MEPDTKNLPHIPFELWREIFANLPNRDVKSIRLTSKYFSHAAELRFDRVFLSPNPLNIEVFRAIADHENFRQQVKEIIWDDARLSRGPRRRTGMPGGESDISDDETEEIAMSYNYRIRGLSKDLDWDFEDEIHGFDSVCDDEDDEDSEREEYDLDELYHVRKGANFKNQNCPLWFKSGCLDSLEDIFERQGFDSCISCDEPGFKTRKMIGASGLPLGLCWEIYRELVWQQDDVLASKSDEKALIYGLARFPALTKVTVTPAAHGVLWCPLYPTPMIRQLPHGFFYPIPRGWPLPRHAQDTEVEALPWSSLDEKNKERFHGFRVVTRALAQQKNNVLELSLDARQIRTGVNCTIFDYPCEEYDNFAALLKAPGFRRLDLALTIRGIHEAGENWKSFRNGRLHKALSETVDMEDMRFYTAGILYMYEGSEANLNRYAAPVPLASIFPFEKWTKIRNFELSRFIVQQDDVLSCLSRLPVTLRSLSLSFLTFARQDHNWNTFLTAMRTAILERHLWPDQRPVVRIGVLKNTNLAGRDWWLEEEINEFLYENGPHPFDTKGWTTFAIRQKKGRSIEKDALDPDYRLWEDYSLTLWE